MLISSITSRVNGLEFMRAVRYAREHSRRIATNVQEKEPQTYQRMDCFLDQTGQTGYCIDRDGQIVNLFSMNHSGHAALDEAISRGATRLNCYDGFLPDFYAQHGFVETSRMKSPIPGEPDIIYMELAYVAAKDMAVAA